MRPMKGSFLITHTQLTTFPSLPDLYCVHESDHDGRVHSSALPTMGGLIKYGIDWLFFFGMGSIAFQAPRLLCEY